MDGRRPAIGDHVAVVLPSFAVGGGVGGGGHMLADAITAHPDGAVLAVIVVPRSGKTVLDRLELGALRIRVAAPPVAGAANAALLRYLADAIGVPRGRLRIVAGKTRRRKRLLVAGLSPPAVADRLAPLLPPAGPPS